VLVLENVLYVKEQKHFPKRKCGERSYLINEKAKNNPKIPPVDVIGGRFVFLTSSLWFCLQ